MAAQKFTNKVTLPDGREVVTHNTRQFTHAIVATDDVAALTGWGVMAKASDAAKAEASARWWRGACGPTATVRVVPVEAGE